MTISDLKEYLKGMISGTGGAIADPSKDKAVAFAIETAYAQVWGANRWILRRGVATLTTTTATATKTYSNLPSDYERTRWMSLQLSSQSRYIQIMTEEKFDFEHPYPLDAAERTGSPYACKVVYNQGVAGSTWRAYWWPVPDDVYSIVISYDRKADTEQLPLWPSHMTRAIVEQALALLSVGNGRLAQTQVAVKALSEAIHADSEISGTFPVYGINAGWDDWDASGGPAREGFVIWDSLGGWL